MASATGWARSSSIKPTAWQFREKIEVPFFAHYLKDRPLVLDKEIGSAIPEGTRADGPRGSARSDQLSDRRQRVEVVRPLAAPDREVREALFAKEAGWRSSPRLPLRMAARHSMNSSRIRHGPCPITSGRSRRSTLNSQWPEWLVQDQRFVHLRPDVLSYETEPLTEDIDVTGPCWRGCLPRQAVPTATGSSN